jgi:uncharacterized protein YrzB (UPF0473 family)
VDAEGEIVTLIDEAGAERSFRLHDAFDVEEAAYYLVEAVEDPDQVLLLREVEGGLESVEGEEFERVIAVLETEEALGDEDDGTSRPHPDGPGAG